MQDSIRKGALISSAKGLTTSYALQALEPRGTLFVGPREDTYVGMIIGESSREEDMVGCLCFFAAFFASVREFYGHCCDTYGLSLSMKVSRFGFCVPPCCEMGTFVTHMCFSCSCTRTTYTHRLHTYTSCIALNLSPSTRESVFLTAYLKRKH